MKSGEPHVEFDPYDWLPGHGESDVNVRTERSDLILEISYDDTARSGVWKRELRFFGTCCFYVASFPGAAMLEVKIQWAQNSLSSLVRYPNSEAARAWRQHFGNMFQIDHFALLLLSENRMIQVFAEKYKLGDPIRVS